MALISPPSQPLTPDSSGLKWYQGLERYCWIVLIIAALGWLFDTMDQNLYNLVRKPSLTSLIAPGFKEESVPQPKRDAVRKEVVAKYLRDKKKDALEPSDEKAVAGNVRRSLIDAEVSQKGGWINAIFLIGWAVGGFGFGIVGDRLGRVKTMVATILIYALFTGLSGLAPNWWMYAIARFLTALGVGGEWAAGAALVAEVFPQRSRAMALGTLQALSAVGNMMACIITLIIGNLEEYWHIAYFIGFLPAIMVFWVLKSVKEPAAWHEAKAKASLDKEMGALGELFSNPKLRRNTLVAILLATAGVGGLWGIGFFSTDMIMGELRTAYDWSSMSADQTAVANKWIGRQSSMMFLVQQVGAFVGIYLFAIVAERISRRAAFGLWFVIAWVSVLGYFWVLAGSGKNAFVLGMIMAPILGFGTLGPFSGYTIYFPELFPTRLRATGCGIGYNAARVFAAPCALMLGNLSKWYTGYGFSVSSGFAMAATTVSAIYIVGFIGLLIAPETKGKPLPTDADFEIGPVREAERVGV
jgi:MFS family permease